VTLRCLSSAVCAADGMDKWDQAKLEEVVKSKENRSNETKIVRKSAAQALGLFSPFLFSDLQVFPRGFGDEEIWLVRRDPSLACAQCLLLSAFSRLHAIQALDMSERQRRLPVQALPAAWLRAQERSQGHERYGQGRDHH
jgi:hypothetical protein